MLAGADAVAVTGANAVATVGCFSALWETGPGVIACGVPATATLFSAFTGGLEIYHAVEEFG